MTRFRIGLLASLLACGIPQSFAAQVTTYSYTDNGLVSAIDGPRTDVDDSTHFAYDAQGHISSLTNALGQQWQYLDYNATGNPTRIVDANRIETSLSYSDGRITALSRAGLTWQYSYDALGQLLTSTTPDGLQTSRSYDDARRLTTITYPDGSVLAFTLDAAGNVTQQTLTQADGKVVALQRAVYDELGRILTAATDQSQQQYQYDVVDNPTVSIDGKVQQSQQQYDALNRLVAFVDTTGKSTQYRYNTQDQLVSLTDANGAATSYSYDANGRLITQQSPDTGLTTYAHDEANNLTSITDARGLTVTQQFDALNRLVSRQLGTPDTIEYRYDEPAGGASAGKLTTLSRTGSTLNFSYLPSGALSELARRYQVNGIDETASQHYDYDTAGRLQTIRYADDVSVGYAYGTDGRITQVTFTAPGITQGIAASGIVTQSNGLVRELTLGNGLKLLREFDTSGQLTSQQWGPNTTTYGYDANGNLTAQQTETYSYDPLDRLIGMTGSQQQSYQYDNVGNRLLQLLNGSSRAFSYQPNSNRQTRISSIPLDTDVAGYLTSRRSTIVRDFRWNELGELQEVLFDNVSKVRYVYNGWHQRVAKVVGNYTTLYDYNPQGQLVTAELFNGTTKSWSRYYLWHQDQPLAQLEVKYNSQRVPRLNTLVYLQTDHLNAPVEASDAQGKTVWRWRHDPFGVGTADRDPDGDGVQVDVPLRFPGQLEDTETGLFYNWHRYYDPSTGRYISSDPLGLAAGVNTYGYVGGNPLGYVDESGLMAIPSPLIPPPVAGQPSPQVIITIPNWSTADEDWSTDPLPRWDGSRPLRESNREARTWLRDQDRSNGNCQRYTPPPKDIPGIPDLRPVRPKTPVQGGGGLRKRWKDPDGNIYEWDSQHGTLERYNKRGKHQGEYSPETGEQTKPADKTREVEP